jgi:hypothetical protein
MLNEIDLPARTRPAAAVTVAGVMWLSVPS